MRVIDLENINYAMRNETQFVLRCEEVFHDKISAAAAAILSNRQEKPVVALTGPSGSGKTTTAMRLQEYLQNLGVKVCLLSMDNFFLPLDKRPPEATDWESPYCVDVDTLLTCISQLLDGMEADIPWYDFKNGTTGGYRKMQGEKDCIVIAEGIHMLNPLIFDKLRGIANGVYVAPRTRIITNDDRIVRPEQLRVARRLIRDYNTRGHSLQETVERAESVDRGEINYIMPLLRIKPVDDGGTGRFAVHGDLQRRSRLGVLLLGRVLELLGGLLAAGNRGSHHQGAKNQGAEHFRQSFHLIPPFMSGWMG